MHLILFIVFAGLCLAGAINLLLQTHPINSALSLVVVMTSLAVLYLLLGAEFLAARTSNSVPVGSPSTIGPIKNNPCTNSACASAKSSDTPAPVELPTSTAC